jgi:HK97 family phage prohead protease
MVVPFSVKNIEEEQDFFRFKGYASTFGNVDLGGDKVMPGAWTETLKEIKESGTVVPILWQHNHSEPLGVYDVIGEDAKGLFVDGRMPKADSFVTGRVMPQMKIGSIGKLSIGYGIKKDGFKWKGDVRELHSLKLFETSLVTFPMNTDADILSFKAIDFSTLADVEIRELERAMKEGIKFDNKEAKQIISLMKSAGMLRDEHDGSRDGDDFKQMEDVLDKILNTLKE